MASDRATVIAGTLIAAMFLAALPARTAAESPAPSPSLDCTSYLVNMSDCLTYVEAGSNMSKPDKGCCPELAGLVESQPICLCQLLSKSDSFGIQINRNKALKLPSVCGVTTPPVSSCSAAGYPVGVPTSSVGSISPGAIAQSPTGEPSSSMVTAPSPSGGMAPAPSLDCTNYLVNLSDCLTYVEAGSNLTTPDKGCCPELAGLVEGQPICLCQLLAKADTFGVQIDRKKALKLPSVCQVTTPPVSLCSAAGYPVAGPTSSEGPVLSPDTMSPAGVPSSQAASGNDSPPSIAVSHLSFLGGLAVAFLTTF